MGKITLLLIGYSKLLVRQVTMERRPDVLYGQDDFSRRVPFLNRPVCVGRPLERKGFTDMHLELSLVHQVSALLEYLTVMGLCI